MRSSNPTAKLKDTAEAPQLSFQRKAVQDFHSRQADKNVPCDPSTVDPNPVGSLSAPAVPQSKRSFTSVDGSDADNGDDGIVNQSMPRMFHFDPGFSSHSVLFIDKKKCSMATQEKGKHTVSQDDTAGEQHIHGKGIFCVSKSRHLSNQLITFQCPR